MSAGRRSAMSVGRSISPKSMVGMAKLRWTQDFGQVAKIGSCS